MQNTSGIQLSALLKLIPVILEFKKLQQEGLQNDVRDVAERVGGTFGIEDVDAFLEEQVKRAVRDGAGIVLDDRAAQVVAEVFAKASVPVMTAIVGFAKGETKKAVLMSVLAGIFERSSASFLDALKDMTGIPQDVAAVIAKRIGLSLVVVCCLVAAYKIFKQVASDDAIAQERRAEVERCVGDAAVRIKEELANLQEFVGKCALDGLSAVQKGIAALDLPVFGGE